MPQPEPGLGQGNRDHVLGGVGGGGHLTQKPSQPGRYVQIAALAAFESGVVSFSLAHKACRDKYTARYLHLPRLLQNLQQVRGDDGYVKHLEQLAASTS